MGLNKARTFSMRDELREQEEREEAERQMKLLGKKEPEKPVGRKTKKTKK